MKRSRAELQRANTPVKLNVGGQVFWTTLTTLVNPNSHYFHRLFSPPDSQGGMQGTLMRDDSGAVFIDRDPRHFPLVLNFLRDGFVPLPPTLRERQELRQEALFYGLQSLANTIEAADKQAYENPAKPAQVLSNEMQITDRHAEMHRSLGLIVKAIDRIPEVDLGQVEEDLSGLHEQLRALRRAYVNVHDNLGDPYNDEEEEEGEEEE